MKDVSHRKMRKIDDDKKKTGSLDVDWCDLFSIRLWKCGQGRDRSTYNLTAVCAMKTEDYAKALECFQAGIALAESKTGDDKTKADTALLQEMEYNVIVCYEQQADWENAKSAMKQYQADFPEDDSVSKEAEFLQTR